MKSFWILRKVKRGKLLINKFQYTFTKFLAAFVDVEILDNSYNTVRSSIDRNNE